MKSISRKAVCLHFEVHQPFRLKRYRFFDLGHDHYYYDDYANESVMRRVASRCYLPANRILLDLIARHKGKFRVAFSISGLALDQFILYAPEVLDSFRELAATGAVEFLAETNSHSLASLKSREEFEAQVKIHMDKMDELFGVRPVSLRNTEMIYSDQIGSWIADMGFKAVLTEGAKHILGWKSPNYLYCNTINPRLKVLLRNFVLSDDIAFRFSNRAWSEWPLTATKYAGWIKKAANMGEMVNIFVNYETFGEHHSKETGIFDFLTYLPATVLKSSQLAFMTPSEIADSYQPIAAIPVISPISWADEERDLTSWLGNELQTAVFEKQYELSERVNLCNNTELKRDWIYLQSSDHIYYMRTKFFSDGSVQSGFNPYQTPYDAFMNYMNILSDFEIRMDREAPCSKEFTMMRTIREASREKDFMIEKLQRELDLLKKDISLSTRTRSDKKSSGRKQAATRKPAAGTDKPSKKRTQTK